MGPRGRARPRHARTVRRDGRDPRRGGRNRRGHPALFRSPIPERTVRPSRGAGLRRARDAQARRMPPSPTDAAPDIETETGASPFAPDLVRPPGRWMRHDRRPRLGTIAALASVVVLMALPGAGAGATPAGRTVRAPYLHSQIRAG